MKKIGVLGTGTMGAGIVQVLAQNGYEVVMRARHQASIDKGIAKVEKALTKMVTKGKITEEDKAAIKELSQSYQVTFNTKTTPSGNDGAVEVNILDYI